MSQPKVIQDKDRERISQSLLGIVQQFNKDYQEWVKETGCSANFGWGYPQGGGVRILELLSIDAQIYQRPQPKWANPQTIQDVLNKAEGNIPS